LEFLLENADLFSDKKTAEYRLQEFSDFGKWATAKIVPVTVVECENEPEFCGDHNQHPYIFNKECGCYVCEKCGDHKGLARCYCGWAASGGNGIEELEALGETIDPDY